MLWSMEERERSMSSTMEKVNQRSEAMASEMSSSETMEVSSVARSHTSLLHPLFLSSRWQNGRSSHGRQSSEMLYVTVELLRPKRLNIIISNTANANGRPLATHIAASQRRFVTDKFVCPGVGCMVVMSVVCVIVVFACVCRCSLRVACRRGGNEGRGVLSAPV